MGMIAAAYSYIRYILSFKQTFLRASLTAYFLVLISLPAHATFIPLTVEESDGLPSGKNVRKIKFPNGTLIDNTGTDGSMTYAAASVSADSLDFIDFEDTLDTDANLTLNQSTHTWTQNFTGDSSTGLTYNANSLTSGTALALSSSSTAITSATLLSATLSGNPASSWTGDLVRFEITGNDADLDGSALKVGVTSSSTAGSASTALNITTAGPSGAYAFKVNDDGTYTDSTAFVIDHTGNVGVGTTTASQKIEIKDGHLLLSNSSSASELRFSEPNGANYSAFKAQAQTADITYTLPSADGSSGQALSTNGSGGLSWANTLASGTYTPTLTNVTNIDSSTAYECQYMRVGNVVTVSGKVDIDATSATSDPYTELGISLPIASNLGAEEDLAGTGVMVESASAFTAEVLILADTSNDRASFRFRCTTSFFINGSREYSFTFTYQVI